MIRLGTAQLRELLARLHVPSRAYSLDDSSADDRIILAKEQNHWVVYYSERGVRSGVRTFAHEHEACDALGRAILEDPSVRRARGATPVCPLCEAADRQLWAIQPPPFLYLVEKGNWCLLLRCPACGAHWVESPYEPYASFPFFARWPSDAPSWKTMHDTDDGATALAWHAALVRRYAPGLSGREAEDVAFFRKRSSGHNPIDSPKDFDVPAFDRRFLADKVR